MKNLENMNNEEKKQFIFDTMTTKITTNPIDPLADDVYVELNVSIKTTISKNFNDAEHKFIESDSKHRLYNYLKIAFTNTDKEKELLDCLKRLRLEERIDAIGYYTLKNTIINLGLETY